MLRALAGTTQEQVAEALDVHPSLIAQIELDEVAPNPEQLEKMSRQAGLTVAGAEELLGHYDALLRSSRWRGEGLEATLDLMKATMRDHLTRGYEELQALWVVEEAAREAEAQRAEELWAQLEKYPEATQMELVEVAEEYQSEALADKVFEVWADALESDSERADGLEKLHRKIRELARKSAEAPSRHR
jgi:transcriptional regulator with XRE-family HTH domain